MKRSLVKKLLSLRKKNAPILFIALTTLAISCQSRTSPPATPQEESANRPKKCPVQNCIPVRVDNCHDGDTCKILTDQGLWFHVRLAGIDAPEVGRFGSKKSKGQPLGQDARQELLKILGNGSDVTMKQLDLDPFNRPIVELYAGSECVNLKLLELGMAERYRGKSKGLDPSAYDAAESLAKKAGLGIWGLIHHESPSKWRKEQKK
jgi:endonuclease YncB( thermonuclease family)